MSDTCIVCLGDLSTGIGGVGAIQTIYAKSPPPEDTNIKSEPSDDFLIRPVKTEGDENDELIAYIVPCGHVLHNQCLTPWRERANSCPICRAAFHLVELKATVAGPTISSYAVEDRQQVADLDPSLLLELADDEDEDQTCQECGEGDNEDVLMFCDACESLCHTYCAGLDQVPYGAWFCDACCQHRPYLRRTGTIRTTHSGRRRTRGQQRRQRTLQVGQDQNWNAVWQSVWSRLRFDLDFPYDDDDSASYIRSHRQSSVTADRGAFAAWQSRLRVAEMQGAGNRFREMEPELTAVTRGARTTSPSAPTAEETLAWDAFDAARASPEPSSVQRSKKRKSPTASPPPSDSETAQPAPKRSRTNEIAVPEPSSTRGRAISRPVLSAPQEPLQLNSSGPSFLQSLLQEVEDSSTNTASALNSATRRSLYAAGSPPATDHSSPRPSSPAGSPLPSNHSSPRAMSPSPPPMNRPGSPNTLSSSIQPIYPTAERSGSPPPRARQPGPTRPAVPVSESTVLQPVPRARPRIPALPDSPQQFSPSTSPNGPDSASPSTQRRIPEPSSPTKLSHRTTTNNDSSTSRLSRHQTPPTTKPEPDASSPTRPSTASAAAAAAALTLSLAAKSDIQKLVSLALKPLYNDQKITKDEYTTINRDVSRLLYDRIGATAEDRGFETLADGERLKWEKVAGEEVGRAVGALKG